MNKTKDIQGDTVTQEGGGGGGLKVCAAMRRAQHTQLFRVCVTQSIVGESGGMLPHENL